MSLSPWFICARLPCVLQINTDEMSVARYEVYVLLYVGELAVLGDWEQLIRRCGRKEGPSAPVSLGLRRRCVQIFGSFCGSFALLPNSHVARFVVQWRTRVTLTSWSCARSCWGKLLRFLVITTWFIHVHSSSLSMLFESDHHPVFTTTRFMLPLYVCAPVRTARTCRTWRTWRRRCTTRTIAPSTSPSASANAALAATRSMLSLASLTLFVPILRALSAQPFSSSFSWSSLPLLLIAPRAQGADWRADRPCANRRRAVQERGSRGGLCSWFCCAGARLVYFRRVSS